MLAVTFPLPASMAWDGLVAHAESASDSTVERIEMGSLEKIMRGLS